MGTYSKHFCFSLVSCLLILNATVAFANPGDPDFSFGVFGVINDHDENYKLPVAMIQQANGGFIVVGQWENNRVLVRRYNSNGSVDLHFGLMGYGVDDLYPGVVEVWGSGTDVDIQSDGKILVSGLDYADRPTLWRYTTYGDLDYDFGEDGIVTLSNSTCLSVRVIAAGSRIIVAINGGGGPSKLMGLKPADGSVDLRSVSGVLCL